MVQINLSKQQALDGDRKAIQQIRFTKNLDDMGQTYMMFILEELKEICFNIPQENV